MSKVFYVYATHGDHPGNYTETFLSLPATPYEILDALDKLRLDEGESAEFRVEEYYRFDSLAPFLSEKHDLYELNALAQKLSELDERQTVAFEGLLTMETGRESPPMKLRELINLAYSTDCCHVVGEAQNDSQLGRFLAENGFFLELDGLPDNVFDLLDFERIGREHRHAEKGVIVERTADHPGGYVERHSDLAEAYKTLDLTPKQPDYTILLKVCKGYFGDPNYDSDKTIQLKLPAPPEALDAALTALDIWDWREAGWSCLDCRMPMLAEVISDSEEGIDSLNRLAQRLADMKPKELTAYKALLEATNCRGSLTSYGLIERKDGQPIQSMEQLPQQGGMEMS